jgi:response regulator RpfG family c-di-GMP phosphodiesterase
MRVAPLVRATHERADGAGYPDGLRLGQIPMGSRVIAVVDAFDAMTSERSYQMQRTEDEARAELQRASGTQFDPDVVEAFLAVLDERARPARQAAPEHAPLEPPVLLPPPDQRARAGSGRRARRT